MSDASNPFASMFEVQRRMIEQNQRAFRQSVEAGKRANRIFLEGLRSGEAVQRSGTEMARTASTASVDAMAAMVPGGDEGFRELKELIDEQFDAANEINDQSWEALRDAMEENVRASELVADQYLGMVERTTGEVEGSLSRMESGVSGSAE